MAAQWHTASHCRKLKITGQGNNRPEQEEWLAVPMFVVTIQHLAGTKMGIFTLRTTFTQSSVIGYLFSSNVMSCTKNTH